VPLEEIRRVVGVDAGPTGGGFDLAPEHWLWDERGPTLGGRRERVIDAIAAGATVHASPGDRAVAAAPSGSAPAAGE